MNPSVPVADYLRISRRGGAVVLGGALAGLLVGAAVLLAQPATFRATVTVFVADAPVTVAPPGDGTPKWITVDTEARRVTQTGVLAGIIRATGDPDPADRLEVGAVPGTKVLTIGYRSGSASGASAGVRAAATGYLAARQAFLSQRQTTAIAGLGGNVDRLTVELAATPKTPAGKAARQQLYNRIGQLQTAMVNSANLSAYPGEELRGPQVSADGDANRPTAPASGAVLGALVGLGLARRRTDSGARRPRKSLWGNKTRTTKGKK
ncbi:hypothetical protein GCM10009765_41860 [Fodinicola feengrottensis]|uniref:Polysaccharide chain length determinant N-terminal domain-containing protein n=1 Tax=Fodinicola feengrottensis TaxID=435914 RepID=A0ABN2HHR0_9ACTN